MVASAAVEIQDQSGSRRAVAALQLLVGALAPLALVSIGGVGIYGAPLLLPLLWITANACRSRGRWYFTVLAGLAAAESAWAASWTFFPDLQLFLPVVLATATVVVFVKSWHCSLSSSRTVVVFFALGALGLAGIGSLAVGR